MFLNTLKISFVFLIKVSGLDNSIFGSKPPWVGISISSAIFLIFTLAGLIKGVIGVGLPTVSLALLSFILDIKESIAIVLIPIILTNFYQMIDGKYLKDIIKDTKYFLLFSIISITPGFLLLVYFNSKIILGILSLLLILNSIISLSKNTIKIKKPKNKLNQIWIGILTGFSTGVCSIYTMPLVLMLQSLSYTKDKIIQFMGITFFLFSSIQIILFYSQAMINTKILTYSIFSIIPIFAGLVIGNLIRKRISEIVFKNLFNLMLLIMGLVIFVRIIT